MADNSATLEKLEADEKKAAAVHAEAKAKLATFRAENRGPKLAELKKDIADYGFTVDFAPVAEKAAYITPVPGGVGLMTRAMLMKNTVKAARLQSGL